MSNYKKFRIDDVFYNTVKTYPKYDINIYHNQVYINNEIVRPGERATTVKMLSQGEISLHELNIDRGALDKIYPFVTKDGARTGMKTISTTNFDNSDQFVYGDRMTDIYPYTASINRISVPAGSDVSSFTFENGEGDYVPVANNKKYIRSLKPTLEEYKRFSTHYAYSSSYGNKGTQKVNMVCIPSIFYGSSIKKGSVKLSFYVSGSLQAQLVDSRENGELLQVSGSSSNDEVAGVVLYNEGILLLTGSWDLNSEHTATYNGDSSPAVKPSWLHFGAGMPYVGTGTTTTLISSSFGIEFEGTTTIPTITMLAHAPKGEYNYSSNPTFVKSGSVGGVSYDSVQYREDAGTIKNITKSPYTNHTASFKKQTYISKIGIYDKNKNLIGIAKLANPIKKTEEKDYTFKLKLDF
tara:strand:- start:73 stop:1299 length:1227 start_codon:yes stop_codon:yes gene_type:complete